MSNEGNNEAKSILCSLKAFYIQPWYSIMYDAENSLLLCRRIALKVDFIHVFDVVDDRKRVVLCVTRDVCVTHFLHT